MIALNNVSLFRPGSRRQVPILLNTSVIFGRREKIGILAASGTGKSALARLFAGVDRPDAGEVLHRGQVSWPLGFAGFLHPDLTAAQNIALLARMTNQDVPRALAFCSHFCGFDAGLQRPTRDLSPTERAILAYGCSMAVPATQFIADETITVGDDTQRMKCEALLEQRMTYGGLVFISKNVNQLKRFCDRFYVLTSYQLMPCEDLQAAQAALIRSQMPARKQEYAHA